MRTSVIRLLIAKNREAYECAVWSDIEAHTYGFNGIFDLQRRKGRFLAENDDFVGEFL